MEIKQLFVGDKTASLEDWSKKNKIPDRLTENLITSIQNPNEFPYLMEDIINDFNDLDIEPKNYVRNAIIRIQIGYGLSVSNLPEIEKRIFITQTIEKLLFGHNILTNGENSSAGNLFYWDSSEDEED